MIFFEGRRTLTASVNELGDLDQVVETVREIRDRLERLALDVGRASPGFGPIAALRDSCSRFLHLGAIGSYGDFLLALGELRGNFGHEIGALAERYGLHVPNGLASLLPPDEDLGEQHT